MSYSPEQLQAAYKAGYLKATGMDGWDKMDHELRAIEREAASYAATLRQAARVDEWMVERAWLAYDEAVETCDAPELSEKLHVAMRAALEAALSAQPAAPVGVPDGMVPADAMRDLYRAYVRTLEAGHDRITSLGGDCDSVEHMERTDPALIVARRILAAAPSAQAVDVVAIREVIETVKRIDPHWSQLPKLTRALAGEKAEGWRDISTAPKDGTRIMLSNGHGVWMAEFHAAYPSGYRPMSPWFSVMLNHGHIPQAKRHHAPTHWQPLPTPPTDGEG